MSAMKPERITRCPNCLAEYRTATKLSSNGMHRANKWWNTCPNPDCMWVLEVRVRPFTRHDETLVKAENKRTFEAVAGA